MRLSHKLAPDGMNEELESPRVDTPGGPASPLGQKLRPGSAASPSLQQGQLPTWPSPARHDNPGPAK
eukprot:gene8387-7689_t